MATSAVARLVVFSDPPNSGAITQDLVVHLNFEGDYTDSSGHNNNGTAVGSPSFAAGNIGASALQFTTFQNGSSYNYVTLGKPTDLNFGDSTDLSVSFWAKMPPNSWRGDPSFVANKDWRSGSNLGWVTATDGDSHFQWNYREAAPNSRKDYDGPPGTFGDANWHHVVVVFVRSGLAYTYVDGVPVDTRSLVDGVNAPTTLDSGLDTNIGQDGTGQYTDGNNVGVTNALIDDVGIWRRALTPQEAAGIYIKGLAGQDLSTASAGLASPPSIPAQPQSETISVGGDVTFSVGVSGTTPFTFQWQKDGANVGGATSSNLTLTAVQPSAAGDYQLIAANSAGRATSAVSRLRVFTGPLNQNLVAWLRFDGNYLDSSGHGNHAAAVGSPTFLAGKIGQALKVKTLADGSSFDYATLGYPPDLQFNTNDFSISFWLNYTSASDDPAFISNKNWDNSSNTGWGVFHQGQPNFMRVSCTGTPRGSANRFNATLAGPSLADGTWHHIALSFWRGQNTRTYVDGTLVNVTPLTIVGSVDTVGQTWTRGAASGGFAVNIGQDGTGFYIDNSGGITDGTAGIEALMDDVTLWRRSLTPQDVMALYNAGSQSNQLLIHIDSISASGGNLTITWSGGTGPYTVERKASLSDTSWGQVQTSATQSATFPIQPGFYRVSGQ
jgi:hypothetical protein